MRKLVIYSKKKVYIPKNIRKNLTHRNTQIQIIPIENNSNSKIELYGYDKELKYKSNNITKKTLKNIVRKIDKMPIGKFELQLRNKHK